MICTTDFGEYTSYVIGTSYDDTKLEYRNELGEIDTSDSCLPDKITLRITQTEKKLKTIEDKHHLSQRWFPECVEYKLVKENLITKIQTDLLSKIKDLARERWVLLRLKAKYAGKYALV